MLSAPWTNLPLPLAAGVLAPVAVLALCIIAGIGTVMLLPGRREAALRKIGGVILLACLLVLLALLLRETATHTWGDLYFWLFSFIAIIAAIRMISHERPVYSALYFMLTVVASAGLFVLLWAEFMAAALVLIYAGAILVTYVFVIMLAQQAATPGTAPAIAAAEYDRISREPVFASAIGFTLMGVVLFLIFDKADGIRPAVAAKPSAASAVVGVSDSAIRNLADYLFQTQLVTLELAGVILTLAMVGAVIIARRPVEGVSVSGPGVVSSQIEPQEVVTAQLTPVDDNPHSIPVYGTENHEAKAYPES